MQSIVNNIQQIQEQVSDAGSEATSVSVENPQDMNETDNKEKPPPAPNIAPKFTFLIKRQENLKDFSQFSTISI